MVNFEAFPMTFTTQPSKADTSEAALFKKLTWQTGEFPFIYERLEIRDGFYGYTLTGMGLKNIMAVICPCKLNNRIRKIKDF